MKSIVRHFRLCCVPLFFCLLPLHAQGASPAVEPAFAAELKKSQEEARKQYPDLANASSSLAKKCVLIEQQMREDENPVVTRSSYPLVIAHRAAAELGIKAQGDPVFKEVLPIFTTATGTTYKAVTINHIHKDGISIAHESGAIKIPYLELTDEQREKYGLQANAPSPSLATTDLASVIAKATEDCEKEIAAALNDISRRLDPLMENTKFEFDREYLQRQKDNDVVDTLGRVERNYIARLSRSAALAKELGDIDTLRMLDEEVRAGSKARFAEALGDVPARREARKQRTGPLKTLLIGGSADFIANGAIKYDGRRFQKNGELGDGRWVTLSHDHIRVYPLLAGEKYWCFKVDLAKRRGTVVVEASTAVAPGDFHFVLD